MDSMLKFADHIQDGLEPIIEIEKSSLEVCQDISTFLQERQDIEKKYGESMHSLATKYLKKLPKHEERSLWVAWEGCVEEVANIGAIRSKFATGIEKKVVEPLSQWLAVQSEALKKVEANAMFSLVTWQEAEKKALDAKKIYHQLAALEAGLPKLKKKMPETAKKTTLSEALERYNTELALAWDQRRQFYSVDFRDALTILQSLEEARTEKMKTVLTIYGNGLKSIVNYHNTDVETINMAAQNISTCKDMISFVNWCPPLKQIPETDHIHYVPPHVSEDESQSEENRSMSNTLRVQHELELYETIDLPLKDRTFIMQEELVKVSPKGGALQTRVFYLFNDMLFYAAKSSFSKRVELRGSINLEFALVRDMNHDSMTKKRSSLLSFGKVDESKGFEIVEVMRKKVSLLIAPTEECKEKWIKTLRKCIEDLALKNEKEEEEMEKRAEERAEKTDKYIVSGNEDEVQGVSLAAASDGMTQLSKLKVRRAEEAARRQNEYQNELVRLREENKHRQREAEKKAQDANILAEKLKAESEKRAQEATNEESEHVKLIYAKDAEIARMHGELASLQSALIREQEKVGRMLSKESTIASSTTESVRLKADSPLFSPVSKTPSEKTTESCLEISINDRIVNTRNKLMADIRQDQKNRLRVWAGKASSEEMKKRRSADMNIFEKSRMYRRSVIAPDDTAEGDQSDDSWSGNDDEQ